ncbi:MAG: acyltransferase [Rubrivivax sp.]|nr:acyltransferase [Rubrivivax sp.]
MIANIQALRAIAALLVVFYHLQAPLERYIGAGMHTSFGASGVDIFFVISGFIMFYTNRDYARSSAQFLKDRVIRIVPLYWMGTFLILAILATGRSPDGVRAVDLGDLLTSLFFIPDVRADGYESPVLTLGWTLIYEMFFYGVFASFFFLRNSVRILLALSTSFLLLIGLGLALTPSSFSLRYFTNPIMLEFLMGGLIAIRYAQLPPQGKPAGQGVWWAGIVLGALAIVATEWLTMRFLEKGSLLRPVLFGLPAALIVWSALMLERSGAAWRSGWIQLFGAASYALYLFHPVIIQTCTIAFGHVLRKTLPSLSTAHGLITWGLAGVSATISICVALAVAILIYRHVETPVTRWLKRVSA